jgi:signal transduction histidine kinase
MKIRPVGFEGAEPAVIVGRRRSTGDVAVAIATAVAVALAVGAVAAELMWRPDVHAAGLRSAAETTITLAALIGAVMLRSRFHQTRRFSDLLLVVALATAAVTEFAFEALPALADDRTGTFGVGAQVAYVMLVTSTLLVAAYAPSKWTVARGNRTLSRAVFAGISVIAIGELIDLVLGPGGRSGSAEVYEPVLGALGFVSFIGLLAAAFGFASRAKGQDRESWLLAGACYLLAIASLQAVAQPLPAANSVTLAEPFRILAFVVLLATAIRLYGGQRAAQEAVSAERIRIANDLHDGLAQDLAFIVTYADRLERKFGEAHILVLAARRALAASRGTIVDLEASQAPSTEAALREVAAELEARFGVDISIRVQTRGVEEPSVADRRDLVRIAREAIVNAVRHGGARKIQVTLGSRDSELLLRISDNGCGTRASGSRASSGTGLGMRAMRSRARSLGGRLIAYRRAGGGTEIDVVKFGREPTKSV